MFLPYERGRRNREHPPDLRNDTIPTGFDITLGKIGSDECFICFGRGGNVKYVGRTIVEYFAIKLIYKYIMNAFTQASAPKTIAIRPSIDSNECCAMNPPTLDDA